MLTNPLRRLIIILLFVAIFFKLLIMATIVKKNIGPPSHQKLIFSVKTRIDKTSKIKKMVALAMGFSLTAL
jgi:hypothetical protein